MQYRHQGISILLTRQAKRRDRNFIEARLRATITRREIKQARDIAHSIVG